MDDWGDVVQLTVVGAFPAVLVTWLGNRLVRRRLAGQAGAGQTTVAVRLARGAHPELSARWQRRRAVPGPGRLDLSRWLIGGWDHLVLDVLAVERGERAATFRDSLVLGDVLDRVLTVHTTVGEIELAVGREQAEWLRARLGGVADPRAAEAGRGDQ